MFKFKNKSIIENQYLWPKVSRDLNYLMYSYIGRKFIIKKIKYNIISKFETLW